MIKSFNRRQRIRAVISVMMGIAAYLLASGFFYLATHQALRMLDPSAGVEWRFGIPAAVLVVISLSGWLRHRRDESSDLSDAVMWKGDVETPGAFVVQDRVNQLSSSAWMLSQLFLAGPLRFLQAVDLWRSCLPVGTDLEQRMTLLLRELKSRNQWVSAESFKDHWEPLSALIRTGHVDFSSIKGRVRASS